MSEFTIRIATLEDFTAIKNLFVDTIKFSCSSDYSSEQIAVWLSGVEDNLVWVNKIVTQYFIVVEYKKQGVVGFGSLEEAYLDLMYVHHKFHRKGVATMLLKAIEEKAIKEEIQTITAHVSITAFPFFAQRGFVKIKENIQQIKGVEIVNFEMVKNMSLQL